MCTVVLYCSQICWICLIIVFCSQASPKQTRRYSAGRTWRVPRWDAGMGGAGVDDNGLAAVYGTSPVSDSSSASFYVLALYQNMFSWRQSLRVKI